MGRGLKFKFTAERMSACSVEPISEQKPTGTQPVTDSSTGKTVGATQQTAGDYTCVGLLLKQTFKVRPTRFQGAIHVFNSLGGWIIHDCFTVIST